MMERWKDGNDGNDGKMEMMEICGIGNIAVGANHRARNDEFSGRNASGRDAWASDFTVGSPVNI
jgi:hypothetical protein